jgi:hypothetical protein
MSDRVSDAITITASVVCLTLLGGGGAALLRSAVFGPGDLWFGDPALLVWLLWGAHNIGKLFGLFLGGALLGRFLRRINPWIVLAWISAISCVGGLVPLLAGNYRQRLADMGVAITALQEALSMLIAIGAVAIGIWFGNKTKTGVADNES